MPFVLTLDECVNVNSKLLKAIQSKDAGTIVDIMTELKASDTKNRLKVRCAVTSQPLHLPVMCVLCTKTPVCAPFFCLT